MVLCATCIYKFLAQDSRTSFLYKKLGLSVRGLKLLNKSYCYRHKRRPRDDQFMPTEVVSIAILTVVLSAV